MTSTWALEGLDFSSKCYRDDFPFLICEPLAFVQADNPAVADGAKANLVEEGVWIEASLHIMALLRVPVGGCKGHCELYEPCCHSFRKPIFQEIAIKLLHGSRQEIALHEEFQTRDQLLTKLYEGDIGSYLILPIADSLKVKFCV